MTRKQTASEFRTSEIKRLRALADAVRESIIEIEAIAPMCADTLAGNTKGMTHLLDAGRLRAVLAAHGEPEPDQ